MEYVPMLVVFFKLLIAHALCDFSLQTTAMAAGKNRHKKPHDDAVPYGQKVARCWPYWLGAHALIHSGGVWVVTNDVRFALVELGSHWLLDFVKCENWTNPHIDQFLHLALKAAYVVAIAMGL